MFINKNPGFFEFLAAYPELHAKKTPFYEFFSRSVRSTLMDARPAFEAGEEVFMSEFGNIILPYERMGAIDSLDLFGLDELIIFAFYFINRKVYHRVADIGANIGIHSIILNKCGYTVESYEPDPSHFQKLERNVSLNNLGKCTLHQKAVSDFDGVMQFVRVLGNTTSSHLAGAKPNPYGELQRFDVQTVDIGEMVHRFDLLKIDAEGHEGTLFKAIKIDAWLSLDAFVEIGSPENARIVYDRFTGTAINMFAQKLGWKVIKDFKDMPSNYRDGSIFVSAKPRMNWGAKI